ncbi:vacuolar ATPase assembly integral membrane protein vma21 [Arachnomyces sp. PD_36]|nr:vacuolar ATPase assembly integral membrane protein vma21 [Arachnomyces sp. PD_36]
MATPRRASPQEEKTGDVSSPASSSPRVAGESDSDISPVVSSSVIYKLLAFTLAMIIAPIGIYFLSLDLVFGGNSTFAGALAAVTANVVLVGYIVVAMREDREEKRGEEERRRVKKGQ